MGPGANETTTGKALLRGLRRSIRDMSEDDLRENLTEIRDKLDVALAARSTPDMQPDWLDDDDADADNYRSAIAQSD
jgi:DNA-binding GntR family transcriptional regulator